MIRVFWPVNVMPTLSTRARVGRVLHWLGTLASALFLVAFAFAEFDEMWRRYGEWHEHLWMLAVCIGIYGMGRGLRYVLAAE